MPEQKKISIEVLMEGPGGDLIFKEISGTKQEILEMLKNEKNPMVRHNLEKQLKEKKVIV